MKKSSFIIIFCIAPVCYIFLSAISEYFELGYSFLRFGQTYRAQILTIAGVMALFLGFSLDKGLSKISVVAFLFALYMFVLGLITGTADANILSFISCVSYWAILLIALSLEKFDEGDISRISTICTVTAIVMSVMFIYGNLTQMKHNVAASNSIYLILCALPFCLINKKGFLKFVGIGAVSVAILMSNKTTCLVALIVVLFYAFRNVGSKRSSSKRITRVLVIIALVLIVIWIYTKVTGASIGLILDDMKVDFESGNGRYNIYMELINQIKMSSVSGWIFGHGYSSVSRIINIGAHNDFLQVFYDYGIIGFSLYIALWVELIKNRKTYEKGSLTYNAYVSSLLIFLCISLASNVINSQINMMFLIVFWGICNGSLKLNIAAQPESKAPENE